MGIVERGAAIVFAKWLQVQFVEQVEEVDAQIQLGALALEKGTGVDLAKLASMVWYRGPRKNFGGGMGDQQYIH